MPQPQLARANGLMNSKTTIATGITICLSPTRICMVIALSYIQRIRIESVQSWRVVRVEYWDLQQIQYRNLHKP